MALSYNLPADSTDIIPLKLDMYRYPKVLYSSNNELIGQKYRDVVRLSATSGEIERVPPDISITNGKYIM